MRLESVMKHLAFIFCVLKELWHLSTSKLWHTDTQVLINEAHYRMLQLQNTKDHKPEQVGNSSNNSSETRDQITLYIAQ